MARKPAVSGQFYPGDKRRLDIELNEMIPKDAKKRDIIGAVSPHAGYVYSGEVAGEVFAAIKPKETYIILSPNHTGLGDDFAVSKDTWETPLGKIETDKELIDLMLSKTDLLTADEEAHVHEHSIEVQLPFIQKTAPKAKIVPITVKLNNFEYFKEIAKAIADSVHDLKRQVVLIASSDMSHYLSRQVASGLDNMAIEKVLALDAEGLVNIVEKKDITMCGFMPTAIMLLAAKHLGAKKAELIRYTDSGEASGDIFQVVGYAGIIVY